jgi:hypothetical protein
MIHLPNLNELNFFSPPLLAYSCCWRQPCLQWHIIHIIILYSLKKGAIFNLSNSLKALAYIYGVGLMVGGLVSMFMEFTVNWLKLLYTAFWSIYKIVSKRAYLKMYEI